MDPNKYMQSISRNHIIEVSDGGLLTIAGDQQSLLTLFPNVYMRTYILLLFKQFEYCSKYFQKKKFILSMSYFLGIADFMAKELGWTKARKKVCVVFYNIERMWVQCDIPLHVWLC